MRILMSAWIIVLGTCGAVLAQPVDTGRATFVARCAGCHGTDGNGGELGPAIASRVPTRTDTDLAELIRDGRPAAGMPAFPAASSGEIAGLVGDAFHRMTYEFDRKQYVAIASGPNIPAFGLADGDSAPVAPEQGRGARPRAGRLIEQIARVRAVLLKAVCFERAVTVSR